MSTETLSAVVGVLLSLAFAYVPTVKERYNALDSTRKATVMAILLVVVAVAIFAASCGALITVGVTCDKQGAVGLVQLLVAALVANQSAYVLLVKPFPQSQPERL